MRNNSNLDKSQTALKSWSSISCPRISESSSKRSKCRSIFRRYLGLPKKKKKKVSPKPKEEHSLLCWSTYGRILFAFFEVDGSFCTHTRQNRVLMGCCERGEPPFRMGVLVHNLLLRLREGVLFLVGRDQ